MVQELLREKARRVTTSLFGCAVALGLGCGRVGYDPSVTRRPDGGQAPIPNDGKAPTPSMGQCDDYPGAIACADFESSGLDPGWLQGGASPPSIVLGGAPQGAGSLHAVAAPRQSSTIHTRFPSPVTDGDLYLRAYVRVVNPEAITSNFAILIQAAAPPGPNKLSVDADPSNRLRLVRLDSDVAGISPATQPGVVVARTWMCLELHVHVAAPGGAGVSELFLDAVRILSRGPGVDTLPPGGFTGATFGVSNGIGNSGPVEVDIDAVVVSRARIGCL
jgi:hypothetical protein